MNLSKRVSLAILVLLAAGGVANAMTRKGTPHVRFVAVGPMGMKIEGTSTSLDVKDEGQTIAIDVPLAPIHTGIALRDRHMHDEYLEVGKYPNARLSVERSALKLPDASPVDASAKGQLTLHGQTRPVSFRYRAQRSGDGIDVSGSLRIDMTNWGIHVPSYLGVTVKPGVDIDVRFLIQP